MPTNADRDADTVSRRPYVITSTVPACRITQPPLGNQRLGARSPDRAVRQDRRSPLLFVGRSAMPPQRPRGEPKSGVAIGWSEGRPADAASAAWQELAVVRGQAEIGHE
jgi:hypothetical protein